MTDHLPAKAHTGSVGLHRCCARRKISSKRFRFAEAGALAHRRKGTIFQSPSLYLRYDNVLYHA